MAWGKVTSWTFECLDCDWRRTTMPTGDVMLHGVTYFDTCPACGSENLMRREATDLERLVERLLPGKRRAS
jgi:Zn finger protein HypA/HybF involved in hydrogenase expression